MKFCNACEWRRASTSGWSLLELLVVILVSGSLMAVALYWSGGSRPQAQRARAARQVAESLARARAEALARGRPVAWVVHKDHYGVVELNLSSAGAKLEAQEPLLIWQALPDGVLWLEERLGEGENLMLAELPQVLVETPGQGRQACRALVFQPDGSIRGGQRQVGLAYLYLASGHFSRDGVRYTARDQSGEVLAESVCVRMASGRARVIP